MKKAKGKMQKAKVNIKAAAFVLPPTINPSFIKLLTRAAAYLSAKRVCLRALLPVMFILRRIVFHKNPAALHGCQCIA